MPGKVMIYGAYGYTGRLVAEAAKAAGQELLLAGRDPERLAAMGRETDLPVVAVDLDDGAALRRALEEVEAVAHCAGPFGLTWEAMTGACLDTRTHYADITGEIAVLEGCARLDGRATAAGVALIPGSGFDVVPTDCMAAMLKARMPDAVALSLAFAGIARASRGTMKTAARHFSEPVQVRRGGKVTDRAGPLAAEVDFGDGPERVYATTWGDVATAWESTGIPDIEVFMRPGKDAEALMRLPAFLRRAMASAPGRWLMDRRIRAMPEGPDAAERAAGRARVRGRVRDATGATLELRMECAEPYHLTGLTMADIAGRLARGEVAPGYHTPSGAFGADYVLGFENCRMLG